MTRKVVQLNRIGTVTFSKNKRSKNIKISVKPDKSVLVSFPFFISSKKVVSFVIKNEAWIRGQQLKFESKKYSFNDGSVLKTKLHEIHIKRGVENSFNINNFNIELTVKDFDSEESQQFINNIITDVFRFEATNLLPEKLNKLASKYSFSYNKVTIRNNKRNWGSCSSINNISLNLQLMKLPDELINYILLHELVHTEIKNHGPKFWEKLNQLTDFRARELAKQVKQFSTYTL